MISLSHFQLSWNVSAIHFMHQTWCWLVPILMPYDMCLCVKVMGLYLQSVRCHLSICIWALTTEIPHCTLLTLQQMEIISLCSVLWTIKVYFMILNHFFSFLLSTYLVPEWHWLLLTTLWWPTNCMFIKHTFWWILDDIFTHKKTISAGCEGASHCVFTFLGNSEYVHTLFTYVVLRFFFCSR